MIDNKNIISEVTQNQRYTHNVDYKTAATSLEIMLKIYSAKLLTMRGLSSAFIYSLYTQKNAAHQVNFTQ